MDNCGLLEKYKPPLHLLLCTLKSFPTIDTSVLSSIFLLFILSPSLHLRLKMILTCVSSALPVRLAVHLGRISCGLQPATQPCCPPQDHLLLCLQHGIGIYWVFFFTGPPSKSSKCQLVSNYFQKILEYQDWAPPKSSKCPTGPPL